MIEIHYDLNLIEFDDKKYSETVKKRIGATFRQAIRMWLRYILTHTPSVDGPGFPSQTGTILGSIQPLGRILRVAVPNPVIKRDFSKWADASQRGPSAGARAVKFTIDDTGPEYRFEWSTQVLHHYLNEFFKVRTVSTTPWKVIDKANLVFEDYLKENVPKTLPSLEDAMKFVRMKK